MAEFYSIGSAEYNLSLGSFSDFLQEEYDAAVDFYNSFKSSVVTASSGDTQISQSASDFL